MDRELEEEHMGHILQNWCRRLINPKLIKRRRQSADRLIIFLQIRISLCNQMPLLQCSVVPAPLQC